MSNFRTLLVIGDNHKEIAKKYSKNLKINEKSIRYRLNDAPKLHKQYLDIILHIIKSLENNSNNTNEIQEIIEDYKLLYENYSNMDDFQFFEAFTEDFDLDIEGNAISDENPNAYYENEICYDEQIRKNQNNEAPFANPFILKNGTKVYSAKKCDIDWNIMHLGNAPIYETVWDLCVDGKLPLNDDEKNVKSIMSNKKDYFANFLNKKEYVYHSSAFWCYSIAKNDEYIECNGRDIDWTNNFYDNYVKQLPDDTTLTIYQIKLI